MEKTAPKAKKTTQAKRKTSAKPSAKPRKTAKKQASPKKATKKAPKTALPSSPLRKSEEKIAQIYWSNYGASCMGFFIITLAVLFFLILGMLNRNPVHFGVFLVGALNVFFLFELVRVAMDNGKKRKCELVASIDKTARPADGFLMKTGFLAQRVGKQTFIFPPELYFQLQKGKRVKLSFTPIFRIVVSAEKPKVVAKEKGKLL